ncbi:MAG: choice-of-anchor B family protein [Flavobacteriia bacterium]
MKLISIIISFLITCFIGFAQESKNISLLDNWSNDTLVTSSSLVRYSGCWGFSADNHEYAIIGSTEGTHFFELTAENKIRNVGFIEGKFNSAQVIHREFKTYQHYAYSVCDEGNSSLQIIDLQYLPDSVVKVADLQDVNFGKTHTLFIDTTNALLYACLVTPIINGIQSAKIPMRVYSLADPLNPVLLWEGPDDIPEVHDCCVRDNIAILNCGQDGLRVYDFSNPTSPIYKNDLSFYQDQGYNHQGWLSPDGQTYVFADETSGKRIKKCSIDNQFNIQIESYFGTNYTNNSVPHNIMITNEFAYVAYYNEGIRIFDIRNNPSEIGSYDTYPVNSFFNMNGAWGVFIDYPSERFIVSDRQYGLFLFDFDRSLFAIPANDDFLCYPNPTEKGDNIILRSPNDEISNFELRLYSATGELIHESAYSQQSYATLQANFRSGIYFLKITYENYLSETIEVTKKLIIR